MSSAGTPAGGVPIISEHLDAQKLDDLKRVLDQLNAQRQR